MRVVVFSALCAVALCGADSLKFEEASVKRMERGVIHNVLGPGTVILSGDPLRVVLMEAFKVKGYQIVGPAWLDDDCFEIVAKMPDGATAEQIPTMLQGLLAERFKLAAHKEDRSRPVYALVMDKGGPKFKEASSNFRRIGLRPGQVMFKGGSDAQGFKGALTMETVAHFLSGHLDRPVVDFTGLEGTYEIDLAWKPDPMIDRRSPVVFPEDPARSMPDGPTVNLFTALRESLRLRLESRTAPVEMLVIDHVERNPTGN